MKSFLKRVLMYAILIVAVFIGCTIDSLNIFKVVCIIGGMIFLWKTFGLSSVLIEEFKK